MVVKLVKAAAKQLGLVGLIDRMGVSRTTLSHRMYLLISFRKSTPPQNCQLIVYFYKLSIKITVSWGS
jgi:hypothetical protein